MTGIVDWASSRARMILAFVVLSIAAGAFAYVGLPKEGEPDIEIPALFISVPFPGISAEDSEKLLVKPMEQELRDLDGLDKMTAVASESYAGIFLEFEFGWDKQATLAEARDAMNNAEARFPDGADQYSINELNFSEIPILVVSLSGEVPERTLIRVIKELKDDVESLAPVLQAALAGGRDEMVEVLIDPLKLEAYNVTAGELVNVVRNNNQLIAAGEVEGATGAFSVKIPSAFDSPQDVMDLPVKVNGDRLIRLGDLADIRLTFEDAESTARYNGETTFALQVSKRKGFNVIDTAAEVRERVEKSVAEWPQELQNAITVNFSMDTSKEVASMVSQLEASVLTAIALVMIVVLSALGVRSALLVGFAIPTSFLLCFATLAVFEISISNIVMFGLILAVGMLVDGAIVVVEYADKRIRSGTGPMTAYREAAKRMFWPIISSTATTLCAFLPMLFWPGVAGEFMGALPVTLIFVLFASLIVALIYLPVVGGVAGRMSRALNRGTTALRNSLPLMARAVLTLIPLAGLYQGFLMLFAPGGAQILPGAVLFLASWLGLSLFGGALLPAPKEKTARAGYRRSPFGRLIFLIAGNPVMPFVSVAAVIFFVISVFGYFGENNNGVEFFVETEPERAIAYVRARGNLSLAEKDELVREVEQIILEQPGVDSVFAFAGSGGLTQGPGAGGPSDTIGQVQIELDPWATRYDQGEAGKGSSILAVVNAELEKVPGIEAELQELAQGPPQGKPVFLRLKGSDWQDLLDATGIVRDHFEATETLTNIEDTRPLPGIDWQIDVDVEAAGRYGADVATVGAMVQLVTRGLTLDTMRVESSDDEIDIRVRLPEKDRVLSTLDTLRVRTNVGLVPLSNFISRKPVPKLAQIDRIDSERYFDIKADVTEGQNPTAEIGKLTEWLEAESPLPASVSWEWTGEQEDQEESFQFLAKAFAGALGLMFVILLAQFNSIYNSVLVLLAVVFSVAGSLIGMLVMGQPFSVIMTGTGIVALAGIVVNNNIVLIDTYQEYARYMPRLEAITRTAEARIRPVLLTTTTTMAGLTPMMLGLSVDFVNGGYTIDSPTSLWWKQLATAVVFGLGLATVLTLVVTPALLAVRVWATRGAYGAAMRALALLRSDESALRRDLALEKAIHRAPAEDIEWDTAPRPMSLANQPPRAAE
ncbi:efflux RND transporter permease subunit [Oceanibium sediminis]|uniref:efflux RND transporter permease subunit n=1 Tax=Oceanibium sediminis TaxID=2026339 RepID=UPI000DD4BEB9|nr:efflux RND transporter permease subunit [Oceanibium sediminis]